MSHSSVPTPLPTTQTAEQIRIGRYVITGQIDAGGMGEIFAAQDQHLCRTVAIKKISPNLSRQELSANVREEVLKRFVREARIMAGLRHPNIVRVFDADSDSDGNLYFVMEYISGETLTARIKRAGSLDIKTALRVALQVASALEAAHSKGFVHRDLKPGNILITEQFGYPTLVQLIDFGIARPEDRAVDDQLTQVWRPIGTRNFWAPEQRDPDVGPISWSTDLYALGRVLHYMLTAKVPYDGLNQLPAPLEETDDRNRRVNELVASLTSPSPKDRPVNADEVYRKLEDILASFDLTDETKLVSSREGERPNEGQLYAELSFGSSASVAQRGTTGGIPIPPPRGWKIALFGLLVGLGGLALGAFAFKSSTSAPGSPRQVGLVAHRDYDPEKDTTTISIEPSSNFSGPKPVEVWIGSPEKAFRVVDWSPSIGMAQGPGDQSATIDSAATVYSGCGVK